MTHTTVPRHRRHTLHFLDEIRAFAPVFLDTDIDMTGVVEHRAAAAAAGEQRYSIVTYMLSCAARAMAEHPDANAAIRGRLRPRLARFSEVHGKLTLDKKIDGQRVVLSAVLPDLRNATLDDIQRQVDHYRTGDPLELPEFAGVRLLRRLPTPLGRLLYLLGVRPLRRRAAVTGTFAVSSLGHRPVDGFHSVGGTTITLGVGRIIDRPVVHDGVITSRPVMRLSLCFDHRVVDGAEAADLLADIVSNVESLAAMHAVETA
jgi:pyruvate/2-oxoglutarate dehydrogenase complex dihydrolipoamide acyltransferase (E2) component